MRDEIEALIAGFPVDRSPGRAGPWREALAGFASASDPLFEELKRAVSPKHLLPEDLLDGARTVIAYFVPFERSVAVSNVGDRHPSASWAEAYVRTNELIEELNGRIASALEAKGFRSAFRPATHLFDAKTLTSDWSHKHAAYAAGLGTFGVHSMLITDRGSAGRLGSLVTDAEIEPTPRPQEEYCLEKAGGSCKKCVKNCLFGALDEGGFQKHRCLEVCLSNAKRFVRMGKADVCGKCVSIAPCSFRRPRKF